MIGQKPAYQLVIGFVSLIFIAIDARVVHGQKKGFDPFAGEAGPATLPAEEGARNRTVASTRPALSHSTPGDQGPTISAIELNSTDINTAFKIISDASGWSIFPSPKTAGKVSFYAKDISAQELLDVVVRMAGLIYVKEGKLVNVMTYDEYVIYYGVIKRVIKLQHRSATEVSAVLQQFITLRGKLMPDSASGTLIIYEVPTNLPLLENVIREIDVPSDHRIVEVLKLKYADVGTLSEHLQEVYQSESKSQDDLRVIVATPAQSATQPALTSSTPVLAAERTVTIHPVTRTNHLIIRGYRQDVVSVTELVGMLDIPSDLVTVRYQITHLPVDEIYQSVEETLRAIFGEAGSGGGNRSGGSSNRGARSSSAGRQGSGSNSEASDRIGVSILKDNNSILVTAPSIVQQQVADLLKAADMPPIEIAGGIKKYRLENTDAAEVAKILLELINQEGQQDENGQIRVGSTQQPQIVGPSQQGPSSPGSDAPAPPGPSADGSGSGSLVGFGREKRIERPRVSVSERTNSVIIQATVQEHLQFAQLIKELDRRLDQVLIEAVLIEIRGDEDLDIGVELESFQTPSESAGHILFTAFGLSTIDPTTGLRTVATTAGGTGALVRIDEVPVILHALQTSGRARIRSNPRILINDNAEGKILNIAEEPFSQINASTTVATTSFGGFVQAGTQFTVTPHISDSDFLRLEYEITLNSFRGPSADPALPPARDTSTISSAATIPGGDCLIVGGISFLRNRENEEQLPLVGDIPGLGALFRRTRNFDQNIRLYVFLSPTVLRDNNFRDLRSISERERHESDEPSPYPLNPPLELEDDCSINP